MKGESAILIRAASLAIVVFVTLGLSRQALAAEVKYQFQPINVPGSAHTVAHGINDRGEIVGVYDTGDLPSGFLLRGGVFTTITVPGTILTTALGINNVGDIVGDFVDAKGKEHVYLLRKGKFTIIDFPGAVATDRPGINDMGDIVGAYFTADNTDVAHGFLRTKDGTFKVIAYPGVAETGPTGINDKGDIVGVWDNDIFFNFHGFVLSGGKFLSIDYPGAVGEAGGSFSTCINAYRQIGGIFVDADGGHGYVLSGGVFSAIDAPAGAPGTTAVFGINDTGAIVGKYLDPTLGHRIGFVATPMR